MNNLILKKLLVLKTKFAASSGIATLVDMGLFAILVTKTGIVEEVVNIISASVGMLINFFLQKRFIFQLNRKVHHTFLLSILVSLGGIGLSTLIIYFLTILPLFQELPIGAKIIATGIVFFYNFYLKRYAFEKRFV